MAVPLINDSNSLCFISDVQIIVSTDVDPNGGGVTTVAAEYSLTSGGPYTPAPATQQLNAPGNAVFIIDSLTPSTTYFWRIFATNADGVTYTSEHSCTTTDDDGGGGGGDGYVVGQDDRLANIGLVLLATVQACLTPRCFTYTGFFPGPPEAPCDVLAVYLDPTEPIRQRFSNDTADDFPCAVGQLVARYIIHLQRCCTIPGPDIGQDGRVTNWLVTADHTQTAMQSARDLMSVYQCLLCNREAIFGECTPMTMGPVYTTTDSCYVHRLAVDIVIDSNCCAAMPCPPIIVIPPAVP